MKDTIEKLKDLNLLHIFELAIEIIAREIIELESEWNITRLNSIGLHYNPKKTQTIKENRPIHNTINNQKYYNDLEDIYLQPAKEYYTISKINGISFGVISWHPEKKLKGRNNFFSTEDYDEYMKKVKSIDYSCFHGKTPQ